MFEDFSDINPLADDISQIVTEQIEDQMASISQHISELTGNLSSNDFRTSENTRRKLEAQHRNLKRKLASVERKARQKAHGEEKRAEHRIRYRSQMKPSDPVSDEERQKVLEMLQSKQISVPDAEILLAALEGRSPEVPEDSEPTEKTEA